MAGRGVVAGICWVTPLLFLPAAPSLRPPEKLASGRAAWRDMFAVVFGVGTALSAVCFSVFCGSPAVPSWELATTRVPWFCPLRAGIHGQLCT